MEAEDKKQGTIEEKQAEWMRKEKDVEDGQRQEVKRSQ